MKPIFHIKEVLKKFVEREPKISRVVAEADAVDLWPRVVDKEAGENSQAVIVKGGTLYVTVSSPVWAQQLSLKRRELVDSLNAALGGGEILKDIKFRSGEARRG